MMKRAIEARAHKATISSRSRSVAIKTPETPALETLCRTITPSNSNSSGSLSHADGDGDRNRLTSSHQTSKRVSVPIPPIPLQETNPELEPVLERTKPLTPTIFNCKDCRNYSPSPGTAYGDDPLSNPSPGYRNMPENFHSLESPETAVAEPTLPLNPTPSVFKDSPKSNELEALIILNPSAFPLGTHLRKVATDVPKNKKPEWDSFVMPPQSLSEFCEVPSISTLKIDGNASDYLAPIALATGTGTTSKKGEPNKGSVLKDPSKQIKPMQGPTEPDPKSKNVAPQSQAQPATNPSPKSEPAKQPPTSPPGPKSKPFPKGRNPCIDGARTGGAKTGGAEMGGAGKCKPKKEDPCQKSPREDSKGDPPKAIDDSCDKLDKEEVCQLLSKLEDNEIRALLNIIKEKVPAEGPSKDNRGVTNTKPKLKVAKNKCSQPNAPKVAEKKPVKQPKINATNAKQAVRKIEAPIKDSIKEAPSAKPKVSSQTPGQMNRNKPGELPPAPPDGSLKTQPKPAGQPRAPPSISNPDGSLKSQPKPEDVPRAPPSISKPDGSIKSQPKPEDVPRSPPGNSKPNGSLKTQPKPREVPRSPPTSPKPDVSLKTQNKPEELPPPDPSSAMPHHNAFPRGRNPCRDGPRTGGAVEKEAIGKEDPCKKIEKKEKVGCEKPKQEPTCSELQSKAIRDLLSKLEEKLSCGFPDKNSSDKRIGDLLPEFAVGDNPKQRTQEQNQSSHVFHMKNVNKAPSSQISDHNVSIKVEVSVKADELSKSLGQAKNMSAFSKENDVIDVTASLLQDTANSINAKNRAENEAQHFQQPKWPETATEPSPHLAGAATQSSYQPKENPKEDPKPTPKEDLAGAATKPCPESKQKPKDLPPSNCNAQGRNPHREGNKGGPAVEYEKSKGKVENRDRLNKLDKEIRTLRKMLNEERSKNSKFKDPVSSIPPTDEKVQPKCQSGESETPGCNKMGYVNTLQKVNTVRLLDVEVPGNKKDGIDGLGRPANAAKSLEVAAKAPPAVTAVTQQERAPKPESQRLTVYASPRFIAFPRGRNPCRDGPRGSAKSEALIRIEPQKELCGKPMEVKEAKVSCPLVKNPLGNEVKNLSKPVKNTDQGSQSKCPKTIALNAPKPKEKVKDVPPCPKKSSEQAKLATVTQRGPSEKGLTNKSSPESGLKEKKEKMDEEPKKPQTTTASAAIMVKEKPKPNTAPAASVAKEEPKPNTTPPPAPAPAAANAAKNKTNDMPKEAENTKKSVTTVVKPTSGTCTKTCSFEVNLCQEKPDDDMPKLKTFPVAPLSDTLKGYLVSIKPLLTAEEFEKEVELTKEFEENEGADLQDLLQEAAEGVCNWLTPRWTTAAYLSYQAPVTVFSSPGMSFPIQKFKCEKEFLTYTAKAIHAVVEFSKVVEDKKMPMTKLGSHYLDNSQFHRIFGTVRTPGRFCDKIEQHTDSDYVVVAYKNNVSD